eukprot:contig_4245_g925
MLASQWILEVMLTWVDCVQRRGMFWNLPPRLIQGLEQLTPQIPLGDIPIGVAVESSTPVSHNFGATLLTVYPKLVLSPAPLKSEMMIITLVRTISLLAASAVTPQSSETPQLEERARAVVATASCKSVAELMTAELARIGSIMPLSAPLGRG